jgi:hypothetical protein
MWSSRAPMHSRYSIRDEAAQQSESPPSMCDAVTGGAISPTIFNLNAQVLRDGAHNSRPGGARLPVCCVFGVARQYPSRDNGDLPPPVPIRHGWEGAESEEDHQNLKIITRS